MRQHAEKNRAYRRGLSGRGLASVQLTVPEASAFEMKCLAALMRGLGQDILAATAKLSAFVSFLEKAEKDQISAGAGGDYLNRMVARFRNEKASPLSEEKGKSAVPTDRGVHSIDNHGKSSAKRAEPQTNMPAGKGGSGIKSAPVPWE